MQTIVVDEEQVGQRLDAYIASVKPEYSRSIWKSLIKDGSVLVDGKKVNGSLKLKLGQKIKILDREAVVEQDLPIIFEDENIIVVNKPAGVLTHLKSDLASESTVAGFIAKKTSATGGNRAGIVHRLDRATSGVLIAAKNDKTRVYLTKQFSNRRVEKWYLAVIKGDLKEALVHIDKPIGRSYSKPSTFKIDPKGKPAQTDVFRLHHEAKYSVVLLKPHTGRTHQLRVHMKYIGHPIIGDPVYYPKYKEEKTPSMLLHAWQLKTTLPDNERPNFVADLPESMTEYFTDECRDKAKAIIASKQFTAT